MELPILSRPGIAEPAIQVFTCWTLLTSMPAHWGEVAIAKWQSEDKNTTEIK
jgi:hypothetical protein